MAVSNHVSGVVSEVQQSFELWTGLQIFSVNSTEKQGLLITPNLDYSINLFLNCCEIQCNMSSYKKGLGFFFMLLTTSRLFHYTINLTSVTAGSTNRPWLLSPYCTYTPPWPHYPHFVYYSLLFEWHIWNVRGLKVISLSCFKEHWLPLLLSYGVSIKFNSLCDRRSW